MKRLFSKLFLGVLATVVFISPCSALSQSEIKENISIDFLDNSYVSIFKSRYVDVDGVKHQLGARDAMSFENSDEGCLSIKESIPEPFLSAVLDVWEDSKTSSVQSLKLEDNLSEPRIRENISINFLDEKSAVIVKTKYINFDNIEYVFGTPEEFLFENSEENKKLIIEEVPECFVSVIMIIWGDTPTVESTKKLDEAEELRRKRILLEENFLNQFKNCSPE